MSVMTQPTTVPNTGNSYPGMNTPMLQQYQSIKEHHQDAILFFRLGDFYEMFGDDAIHASSILKLTLTGRGKDENRVPMCGIPFHAAQSYIDTLVQKGYKVALCEQVEEAQQGKGLTKRDVVKVVTPGTHLSAPTSNARRSWIMALAAQAQGVGLSIIDYSTGCFFAYEVATLDDAYAEIHRLAPKELLCPFDTALPDQLSAMSVTHWPICRDDVATDSLCRHFKVSSLQSFGLQPMSLAIPAAWAALEYVQHTQKNSCDHITRCQPYHTQSVCHLDAQTLAHLDILPLVDSDQDDRSLFHVMNQTQTALGERCLLEWLTQPSLDLPTIEQRYDDIDSLNHSLRHREELRNVLSQVNDIERVLTRVLANYNNPRDIKALMSSLEQLDNIQRILQDIPGQSFERMTADIRQFLNQYNESLIQYCLNAFVEELPATIREGQVFKDEFSSELAELKLTFKDIKEWIHSLEGREREATGISSLKVSYNKVFGYYIQISNAHQSNVPDHYIRKQTLTNAERYITPELKEKEIILLNGEDQQIALEQTLYTELTQHIQQHIEPIQTMAQIIGRLDCLLGLAILAQENKYSRPTLCQSDTPFLHISESRHPVLDQKPAVTMIPNSLTMDFDDSRFWLITGPNMAGKSTLMRQIALIVIMAQAGSFVPATSLSMSLVDQVFTRIGANDNLYDGQSTFMVEMLETAAIIHQATRHSLILLDEIGRGTSTYDGMSLAMAISEHIHDQIQARTLFATHYHELTDYAESMTGFQNGTMSISDSQGQLIFHYTLKKGIANKSYGIHVAKMAGIPTPIIDRASDLMDELASPTTNQSSENNQLSLWT